MTGREQSSRRDDPANRRVANYAEALPEAASPDRAPVTCYIGMAPSSQEDRLKPLAHGSCRTKIAERRLVLGWVDTVARHPLWTMPEPNDPELERRFAPAPKFGNCILRVAWKETERELRIVTATFDLRPRRPT